MTIPKRRTNVEVSVSYMDWPYVGFLIVFAVALPVIVLQFMNSLDLRLVHVRDDRLRGLFLMTSRWSAVPLFAFASYFVSRVSIQGLYLSVFGLLISLIIEFNFRGANIRDGTFDFYEANRWFWLTPVAIGFSIGCVVGIVRFLVKSSNVRLPHSYFAGLCVFLVFVAAVVSYIEIVTWNPASFTSAFAPTRHLALAVLGVILSFIFLAAELKRVSL